jgi:hypothetical protein
VTPELRSYVEAWISDDPDDVTRSELSQLLHEAERDEGAAAELIDRFSGNLQFGTAGLRGALAAGPNRMNRAVVIRAAAGLAAYLTATGRNRDGSHRLRRASQLRRVRPRHRSGSCTAPVCMPNCSRGPFRRRCWRSRSATWERSPG